MKRILLLTLFLIPINCLALDIYNYDGEGYLISKGVAGVSPLDQKPLIPRNATTLAPMKYDKNTQEAKYENGKWAVVISRAYLKAQKETEEVALKETLSTKNTDGAYIYKNVSGQAVLKTEDELIADKINIEKLRIEKERQLKYQQDLTNEAKTNLGIK